MHLNLSPLPGTLAPKSGNSWRYPRTCWKTALKRHASSKKHQEKIKMAATSSLSQMVNHATSAKVTTSKEVKLCALIVQYNLSLSLSEDVVELLRSLFPNDAALEKVTLGKHKTTNVVRQVLGFDYLAEMVSLLRSRIFSIIIDEATDQSTKDQLTIVATFFDVAKFELQYWLVDKETLNELNIPMVNIMDYSWHTSNVILGQYNSVSHSLKSEINYVQVVMCSCHLIHLVSSQATLKLPKSVEDQCRDVYAHFHRSSCTYDHQLSC